MLYRKIKCMFLGHKWVVDLDTTYTPDNGGVWFYEAVCTCCDKRKRLSFSEARWLAAIGDIKVVGQGIHRL